MKIFTYAYIWMNTHRKSHTFVCVCLTDFPLRFKVQFVSNIGYLHFANISIIIASFF